MIVYRSWLCNLIIVNICRCGGIGRRIRLKIVRETIWVRVPSAASFFSIYYHIVQKYLQSFLDNRMFYLKGFFILRNYILLKQNRSARMIKAAAIATASFKNTFCSPTVLLSLIQYTAGRHLLISAVR